MAQYVPTCDAYFESVQYKKKLPESLQKSLTSAFKGISVSTFPEVPSGDVIEIEGDTSLLESVRILSDSSIMAAPVLNPNPISTRLSWQGWYLGILDYSAIIVWLLKNADVAAEALSSCGSAMTKYDVTIAEAAKGLKGTGDKEDGLDVGEAAVADGVAGQKSQSGIDAEKLDDEIYRVLMVQEPFTSATAGTVVKRRKHFPFYPVVPNSSMLTVLLLLSKYRLRNVPVVRQDGGPHIVNFITQTAVIRGLEKCKGRDWFDFIANLPLTEFGLPFMSTDEMISVNTDDLLLEAFKLMTDNYVAGIPVFEGPNRRLVANLSIRAVRFLLIRPDLFSDIRDLTVMEFIKIVGSAIPESGLMDRPLMCGPDDTMGSIIEKISSRYMHRIYVVEGTEDQVVGLITLRDIISCFITEPAEYNHEHLRIGLHNFHQEPDENEQPWNVGLDFDFVEFGGI